MYVLFFVLQKYIRYEKLVVVLHDSTLESNSEIKKARADFEAFKETKEQSFASLLPLLAYQFHVQRLNKSDQME